METHRICLGCGKDKPAQAFDTMNAHGKKYKRLRSRCKECKEAKRRLKVYNLTPEDYDELQEEQEGKCAICGLDEKLVIDHDHDIGIVRGLLCDGCNRQLGLFEDKQETWEKYLSTVRLRRETLFVKAAQLFARRSTCPRASVGAVIVHDKRIVAHGYNGAPKNLDHCEDVGCHIVNGGCIRATHAEVNALAFAAKNGLAPLHGSEIFTTHAPCLPCAQLVISAGVVKWTYVDDYRIKDGLTLLQEAGVQIGKWTQ